MMFGSVYSQCLGDMNDDYSVDIQDVVIIINTIVYNNEIDFESADINGDGSIDILDIISVINIILYENNPCTPLINISYNIHESLPVVWVEEFYIIINNLLDIIPAYQNYFENLNVYWHFKVC